MSLGIEIERHLVFQSFSVEYRTSPGKFSFLCDVRVIFLNPSCDSSSVVKGISTGGFGWYSISNNRVSKLDMS